MTISVAKSLASLPPAQRDKLLARYGAKELAALRYDWRFWGRPEQLTPTGRWDIWVNLAGRGWGKTRTGSEWVQAKAHDLPGSHGALISLTPADARDVMIEGGDSSLLKIAPPWFRPEYEPSKRRLTWPNGTWATVYSSAEYEKLRGPQHHWGWCDELCAWHYPQETWDMYEFGLRLGEHPQTIITTTPKPIGLLRAILAKPRVVVTGGSTYDNADNLAAPFLQKLLETYEGTTLGEQELHARLLSEMPGAMWKRSLVDRMRGPMPDWLDVRRVSIGIDPSISKNSNSDECGIVMAVETKDKHAHIIRDVSERLAPIEWARRAIGLYEEARAAMASAHGGLMAETVMVIAETNQGGEMVEQTLRTALPTVAYRDIHASDSKRVRAQPVAMLSEQGRVHLVGAYGKLEDEMCTWTEEMPSPNRLDAMVYAVTHLLGTPGLIAAGPSGPVRESNWQGH